MNLTERAAYLKGLADGVELDANTKEGKMISALIELVSDMADEIAEMDERIDTAFAYCEELDEDLGDVEEILLDEDCDCDDCDGDCDECDCCCEDEDFFEVECPACGEETKSNFSEDVKFIGARANPFPYVAEADVFALLSRYEGIPNTIYEAHILGIPVLSTNVGGINTQITQNVNGWLVESTTEAIYEGIKHILLHPEEIKAFKKNLESYHYDNEKVIDNTNKIFFGDLEENSKKS